MQDTALEARVVETLVGALIGAAVNLLVMPPVHLPNDARRSRRLPSGVARLLRSVADGLRGEWGEDEPATGWSERAGSTGWCATPAPPASRAARACGSTRGRPGPLPIDPAALDRAVDSLEHVAVQCRSIAATLLDLASGDGSRMLSTSSWTLRVVLTEVARSIRRAGRRGDRGPEVENLRGAVRSGGDKWRELRSRIQQADVHRRDSLPYGSLLVDAERILDELERAEDSLAVSTP